MTPHATVFRSSGPTPIVPTRAGTGSPPTQRPADFGWSWGTLRSVVGREARLILMFRRKARG
ncbi:hypothetical protein N7504_010575 [Penicillium tannophilum]|nr:hypothetical protein N7504_010575 [Penicillium tannophilum]